MNQPTPSPTFLIWDADDAPIEAGDATTILWRSLGPLQSNSCISLPLVVEAQAETLKARFLEWVAMLGERVVGDRRLVDHLELRPGFSYWWMTLLVEKSYGKSVGIYAAIRMLALERLTEEHAPVKIVVATDDGALAEAVRRFCANAGLGFAWREISGPPARRSLSSRCFRALPVPMRGLIVLGRQLVAQWPLRGLNGACPAGAADNEITLVDYLFHLEPRVFEDGVFGSRYWGPLVDLMARGHGGVRWLHHFVPHDRVPDAAKARRLLEGFNRHAPGREVHGFVEAGLSWAVLRRATRDYVRVLKAGRRVRAAREFFRPPGSKVDLWPLFAADWKESLVGGAALAGCLSLNLYEAALAAMPRQKMGVYLQENQGWEKAFIYAWRAAGHGRLIGVPHATIRYWDLRYFYSSATYARAGRNAMPLPDAVALNGPVAVQAYLNGGYPASDLVPVEALRYLYLQNQAPVRPGRAVDPAGPLRVLILGDYLPEVTRRQMDWIAAAAALLPPGTRYRVRAHPNSPIDGSQYPALSLAATNESLESLLADCDVAYTSNITSAAVDAYCAGIPVVSVLDGNAFNMSPLKDVADVAFADSPQGLAAALLRMAGVKGRPRSDFFYLDRDLPRWRQLLGSHVSAPPLEPPAMLSTAGRANTPQ